MHKLLRPVGAAVISAAALAGTPGTSLALGATPMSASPSATIQVQSQAQLQPDGSALVTVSYSCLPGFGLGPTGTMVADLEQAQAAGFAATPVTCDDSKHTVTLDAAPGPFTRGAGSLFIDLTASNADVQDQVEVNIN